MAIVLNIPHQPWPALVLSRHLGDEVLLGLPGSPRQAFASFGKGRISPFFGILMMAWLAFYGGVLLFMRLRYLRNRGYRAERWHFLTPLPTLITHNHSHYHAYRTDMSKATESQKPPSRARKWWERSGLGPCASQIDSPVFHDKEAAVPYLRALLEHMLLLSPPRASRAVWAHRVNGSLHANSFCRSRSLLLYVRSVIIFASSLQLALPPIRI